MNCVNPCSHCPDRPTQRTGQCTKLQLLSPVSVMCDFWGGGRWISKQKASGKVCFFLLSKLSGVYQGQTLVQKHLQVPNPALWFVITQLWRQEANTKLDLDLVAVLYFQKGVLRQGWFTAPGSAVREGPKEKHRAANHCGCQRAALVS